MVGIYKITNIKTGQSYIGQSKNLEKRLYQHKHSNDSLIDKEIQKDPNNFTYEILEICSPEELIEKETYYIAKYSSAETGYNCAIGGCSRPGEKNSNSKVTIEDVIFIRTAYSNKESKQKVYEQVKDKINWRGFEKIWNNETWIGIMNEVYTSENKYFYTHDAKSNPQTKIFTDEEVIEFRQRFASETCKEIYNSDNISERCTYNTFENILLGFEDSYKHLPVYKKREKVWCYSK